MAWRISIVLIVVGVMLLFFGSVDYRLRKSYSDKPEEISLKALIARGASGNNNILLKDFRFCSNYVVTEEGTTHRWKDVWVPIVPPEEARGQEGPVRTNNIRALLFSIKVRNEQDLEALARRPTIPALVTTGIVSLDGQTKKLLEQSYPGTDFTSCVIVQEGRTPLNPIWIALLFIGGGACTLTGVGMLAWKLVEWRRESAAPSKKRKKRRPVEEDEEEEEEAPRPKKRRPVAEDDEDEEPRPRKRRPVEDDEDEEPRPRRRR